MPLLTPRQTQILRLYAAGGNEQTIAKQLYLGVYTIRTHIQKARKKLGARTIAEAVAKAYELRILP